MLHFSRLAATAAILSVLMAGLVVAMTLGVLALRRGRLRTMPSVPPTGASRQIELGEVQ